MIEIWIELYLIICIENLSKVISKFENSLRKEIDSFSKTILKFEKIINKENNKFRKDYEWRFCIIRINVINEFK